MTFWHAVASCVAQGNWAFMLTVISRVRILPMSVGCRFGIESWTGACLSSHVRVGHVVAPSFIEIMISWTDFCAFHCLGLGRYRTFGFVSRSTNPFVVQTTHRIGLAQDPRCFGSSIRVRQRDALRCAVVFPPGRCLAPLGVGSFSSGFPDRAVHCVGCGALSGRLVRGGGARGASGCRGRFSKLCFSRRLFRGLLRPHGMRAALGRLGVGALHHVHNRAFGCWGACFGCWGLLRLSVLDGPLADGCGCV